MVEQDQKKISDAEELCNAESRERSWGHGGCSGRGGWNWFAGNAENLTEKVETEFPEGGNSFWNWI